MVEKWYPFELLMLFEEYPHGKVGKKIADLRAAVFLHRGCLEVNACSVRTDRARPDRLFQRPANIFLRSSMAATGSGSVEYSIAR
jgi:hypothetical protein